MIRFILKRSTLDSCSGLKIETLFTIDGDLEKVEWALCRGGSGESGYEYTNLVGVELIPSQEKQECQEK